MVRTQETNKRGIRKIFWSGNKQEEKFPRRCRKQAVAGSSLQVLLTPSVICAALHHNSKTPSCLAVFDTFLPYSGGQVIQIFSCCEVYLPLLGINSFVWVQIRTTCGYLPGVLIGLLQVLVSLCVHCSALRTHLPTNLIIHGHKFEEM